MVRIDGFMGQSMDIPEDRFYSNEHHLWLRRIDEEDLAGTIEIGITQPGLALEEGWKEVNFLVGEGDQIDYDEELIHAETGLTQTYVKSPLPGKVTATNCDLLGEALTASPYDNWLLRLEPDPTWEGCLSDARGYIDWLAGSGHASGSAAERRGGADEGECTTLFGGPQ